MKKASSTLLLAVSLTTCAYGQNNLYYQPPNQTMEIHETASPDEQAIVREIQMQLQAIRSHSLEQAYQQYTSKEFKDVTSLEQFANFINFYPVLSQNTGLSKQSVEAKEIIMKLATFHGALQASDGTNLRVEYNLVKEGPDWKIIGIRLYQPPGYQPIPFEAFGQDMEKAHLGAPPLPTLYKNNVPPQTTQAIPAQQSVQQNQAPLTTMPYQEYQAPATVTTPVQVPQTVVTPPPVAIPPQNIPQPGAVIMPPAQVPVNQTIITPPPAQQMAKPNEASINGFINNQPPVPSWATQPQ